MFVPVLNLLWFDCLDTWQWVQKLLWICCQHLTLYSIRKCMDTNAQKPEMCSFKKLPIYKDIKPATTMFWHLKAE